jgi:cell division protein FtsB
MARYSKRLSYKKELYYIGCIVSLVVILLLSLFGPGGYRDLQKARLELKQKQESVEELKRNNQMRMQSIEALRSDPDALERYAREKGYAKEGEIIQHLSK